MILGYLRNSNVKDLLKDINMEGNMYTIGQFSQIGKVSTKMLRHYDRIGLLKPEYVNSENRYRYYSRNQIKDIIFINRLKAYRFSLEEIGEIIKKNDLKYLEKKMEEKLLELKEEIRSSQFLLQRMKEEIELLEKGEDIMASRRKFDITIDNLKPFTVLSVRDTLPMNRVNDLFEKAFENLEKCGLSVAGECMSIYYDRDFDPDMADVEVCVPVNRQYESEDIKTRTIEGGLHVHTTFIGPYSEIGEGYAAILDWIKENDYKVIRSPFARFIKSSHSKCSPQDYITEIYFPVGKI